MTDILHVPYTYFPDRTGGTETYVAALTRGLRERGLTSAIAAPVDGGQPAEYVHDDTTVHRYRTSNALPLEQLYGVGDPLAASAFGEILDRVQPRIVHIHAWASGISLLLLRAARARGIPVVFTYHTPAVSCARGSLMLYGEAVCDGALFVDRCTRCYLQHLGLPLPVGRMMGRVPPTVGRALRVMKLEGGAWTALRMTELMHERHSALGQLLVEADELVAVQDWVFELLLFLGASPAKLSLSRLTLPMMSDANSGAQAAPAPRVARTAGHLRLAFFGRVEKLKGLDVVVRALLSEPALPARLDAYGSPGAGEGEALLAALQLEARDDARITFHPPVPTPAVVDVMREYDALVVPSIWMETGPLVVPEALAAGIPVLASNRGGIPSFLTHDVDSLLLPPGDQAAWATAIRRLATEPGLLERLTLGVRPPEPMDRVVREMIAIYRRQLAPHVPVGR